MRRIPPAMFLVALIPGLLGRASGEPDGWLADGIGIGLGLLLLTSY